MIKKQGHGSAFILFFCIGKDIITPRCEYTKPKKQEVIFSATRLTHLNLDAREEGRKRKQVKMWGNPRHTPDSADFCLFSPEVLPLGGKCVPLGLWMGTVCNAGLSEGLWCHSFAQSSMSSLISTRSMFGLSKKYPEKTIRSMLYSINNAMLQLLRFFRLLEAHCSVVSYFI